MGHHSRTTWIKFRSGEAQLLCETQKKDKRCCFSWCRCEDLAELIWLNRQYIRQLKMIHESLNIPSQEGVMNILPELSEGLSALLESLVKKYVSIYFS